MSFRMRFVMRSIILLTVALSFQFLHLPTTVHMFFIHTMFFLATLMMGGISAIIIGMLAPWIGFYAGSLPVDDPAIIPYIILGNFALIAVFRQIQQKNFSYWYRIILATVASLLSKYIFIIILSKIQPEITIERFDFLQNFLLQIGFLSAGLAILTSQILRLFGVHELEKLQFKTY